MGLASKVGQVEKPQLKQPEPLSNDDIKFIITKLQDATYKGSEFENFYNVNKKLSDILKHRNLK